MADKKLEVLVQLNDQFSKKMSSIANTTAKSVKTMMAVTGTAIAGFTAFGVRNSADLQSLSTNFETLTGSVEKGRKVFQDLVSMGASTPFEVGDLAKATQTMLSFGISVENSQKTLQMLGDVSLGNRDKLQGLTLAFSQVQSAGRLTGQDLLQMINQGFNPLTIIAQKTGKSMSVLKKEMEDGAISAEMVTDAFVTATSEGGLFYRGMDRGAKTLSGTFSTLMDNVKMMAAGLLGLKDDGTILEGSLLDLTQRGINSLNQALSAIDWVSLGTKVQQFVRDSIDYFQSRVQILIDTYNKYQGIIINVGIVLGTFAVVVASVMTVIGIYNATMAVGTAITTAFGVAIAFLTSPIGIVIVSLTALISTIILVYRNWDSIGNAIKNIMVSLGNTITSVISGYWNAISSTRTAIFNAITSPFRDAIEWVNKLISNWNPLGRVGEKINNTLNNIIGRKANGGLIDRTGLYRIDETGPEDIILPKGSRIVRSSESGNSIANKNMTQNNTINVYNDVDWEVGISVLARKLRLS